MNNINLNDVIKIKNEIKILLDEIDDKEEKIIKKVENNTRDILVYKTCLEEIVEEYHLICKKIYK
jgi:hypothetical protein